MPEWQPATVPGCIHLDLLAQHRIPDPFFGLNESKLQWISEADWEYKTDLPLRGETLSNRHVELVFEGLDAFAKVFVNDQLVLTANNQFRIWRVDVKSQLKAGDNILRVVFPAQDGAALEDAKKDPWYPRNTVSAKSYLRKAAYEHGWDWGPTFVTAGIWKPIRLESWNTTRISDFHVRQSDVSANIAHLVAEVTLQSDHDAEATVQLTPVSPSGTPFSSSKKVFALHAGENKITLPVEVEKPQLWFPAGYGGQPLYTFNVNVEGRGEHEQRDVKIGLRSLELRRDKDEWGRSFEFVVNGVPIFAKGADVIPSDSFANRVTEQKYRTMLESAKDANMNMVRLWGGGYYESDTFYDICDELGLMVWNDFMFGNDWQPGTYDFKLNVKQEAEDQLRRLRNHPSIVLWSGNNETEMAFHWMDRDKLPPDVHLQIWQDYLTVFHGVLASSVARLDPEVPYWPSSPSADLESTSADYASGDEHIWDVWHGRVPFSTYETHHPRFVSEYGFQSFPDIRTIETFTAPEDRTSIFTPVMLAHQKNGEGNALIREYMLRDYPEPKDFASFVYASQILQAEGIKLGAEHFRRERPRTMGSIFWQLNDCWPVASWSSIDSTGRWKALQYYARRFYAPVLASSVVEGGVLNVYTVSDRTEARHGTLSIMKMKFDGTVLFEKNSEVDIPALSSRVAFSVPLSQLSSAQDDLAQSFVVTTLKVEHEETSRTLTYLVPTKLIHLPKAHLAQETLEDSKGAAIKIHSDSVARSVEITSSDPATHFEDNFFDLLPGETRIVHLNTKHIGPEVELRVRSLSDAF